MIVCATAWLSAELKTLTRTHRRRNHNFINRKFKCLTVRSRRRSSRRKRGRTAGGRCLYADRRFLAPSSPRRPPELQQLASSSAPSGGRRARGGNAVQCAREAKGVLKYARAFHFPKFAFCPIGALPKEQNENFETFPPL